MFEVEVSSEDINAVKTNKQQNTLRSKPKSIDFSIQYTRFSNFRCP